MLQTLPKTVEVLADGLVLTLTPADKADDDRHSNEMCAQPVDRVDMSEIFDPKWKRRRVKKRPPVAHRVLPAMPRPREHRAAPRRGGGTGREDSGDDGGGGGSGDGPPPPPPPPHLKSERGSQAAVCSRAPRVLEHGRARP